MLGCDGQDGAFICKSLIQKDYEVVGVSRSPNPRSINHEKLGIEKEIIRKTSDVNDINKIDEYIESYQPNEIYNLAAQSSVGRSFNKPVETIEGIINGTLNLLETCKKRYFEGRIFFAGSSEMFGHTAEGADIHHPHKPLSPYAIGKQSSYNLVKFYRETYKLKCVTGVLFNHESNLRSNSFVTQKIINAAKKISIGKINKLKLGNINIIRDWGWAPEYVEAMQLITNAKELKDYVICTGEANTLEKLIDIVFNYFNLDWKRHIEIDHDLCRPNEIEKSYGKPKQLLDELGWQATIKLEEIIYKMLNN